MGKIPEPWLGQFAFSVADLPRAVRFFCEVLGFKKSNGLLTWGDGLSAIQGLPGPGAATLWWVIDRQDFVQVELWNHTAPRPRPRRDDWRPSDVGYTMLSLHVDDFDGCLARLSAAGISPLAPPEDFGGGRRVCFRDYEGLLFELMERDVTSCALGPPRGPGTSVAVRAARASVPDIDRARRFWCEGLGFTELTDLVLHPPQMERLWGLDGARREAALFRAGATMLEVARYEQPLARGWRPGYTLNDYGFLNVALGFRSRDALQATFENLLDMGYTANVVPGKEGPFATTYVTDDQGFSVEMWYNEPALDGFLGFEPERTFRDIRPPSAQR